MMRFLRWCRPLTAAPGLQPREAHYNVAAASNNSPAARRSVFSRTQAPARCCVQPFLETRIRPSWMQLLDSSNITARNAIRGHGAIRCIAAPPNAAGATRIHPGFSWFLARAVLYSVCLIGVAFMHDRKRVLAEPIKDPAEAIRARPNDVPTPCEVAVRGSPSRPLVERVLS